MRIRRHWYLKVCSPFLWLPVGFGRRNPWGKCRVASTNRAKNEQALMSRDVDNQHIARNMLRTVWWIYATGVAYMHPAPGDRPLTCWAGRHQHTASNMLKKEWWTYPESVAHKILARSKRFLTYGAARRQHTANVMLKPEG